MSVHFFRDIEHNNNKASSLASRLFVAEKGSEESILLAYVATRRNSTYD